MARRNEHSQDQLRHMAVDAAIRLLHEKGEAGLSMRNVAGAIGYTVGTLYHLFRNRDELLFHVHAATISRLDALLAGLPLANKAPKEQLLTIAQTVLGFVVQESSAWHAWMDHRVRTGILPPEHYKDALSQLMSRFEAPFLAMTMPKAKAAMTARVFWAGLYGISHLSKGHKMGNLGADKIAEMLLTLILSLSATHTASA